MPENHVPRKVMLRIWSQAPMGSIEAAHLRLCYLHGTNCASANELANWSDVGRFTRPENGPLAAQLLVAGYMARQGEAQE